jgi:antirestriction protein
MATKNDKILQEIAEYEMLISDKSVPADEKEFAREQVAELKAKLSSETTAKATAKAPAKPSFKTKKPVSKEVKEKVEKRKMEKRGAISDMSKSEFNTYLKKLSERPEYAFLKEYNYTKNEVMADMKRASKPIGWRFKGKSLAHPTASQIKSAKEGKRDDIYKENRPNHGDASPKAKFGTGGGVEDNYSLWKVYDDKAVKLKTGSQRAIDLYIKKNKLTNRPAGESWGLETWKSNVTEEQVLKHDRSYHSEYATGGKLGSKSKYVPNRMITEISVERKGKETIIDGADVLDGMYVKKGTKFAGGGSIESDITKLKKKLIAQAKSKGIYENFGQKEVRMLEDKYGYTPQVQNFDNWAMNFDMSALNQYARGGGISPADKRITESVYDDMMGVLPPIMFDTLDGEKVRGFAVDEASDHKMIDGKMREVYSGYYEVKEGEKYNYYAIGEYVYFDDKGNAFRYDKGSASTSDEPSMAELIEEIVEEKGIPESVVETMIKEYGLTEDDVKDWFDEHYEGEYDSDEDLAYGYVDMVGGLDALGKQTLESYFDYSAFGRDLALNDFHEYDGHYFRYKRGGMMARGGKSFDQREAWIDEISKLRRWVNSRTKWENMPKEDAERIRNSYIRIIDQRLKSLREWDEAMAKRQGQMARGGKLGSKAKYIPNRMVTEVSVERNGRETIIDGADILDGFYAKKGVKFANGGSTDDTFTYMMLGRLIADNDYYLGYGNRSERNLWAGNVDDQISEMKKLWNQLPADGKPEWLSMQDILNYEEKMKENKFSDGGTLRPIY